MTVSIRTANVVMIVVNIKAFYVIVMHRYGVAMWDFRQIPDVLNLLDIKCILAQIFESPF